MYKEEIDLKLIDLRKRLDENIEEYTDIEQEIDDLACQTSNLEDDRRTLETEYSILTKQIKNLETELIEAKSIELDNTMTGDEFRNCFIKCSFFCRKYEGFNENHDDPLRYVKIKENELRALDGCRGIIIRCNDIPDELRNTYIKWSTRDNFKDHIKKEDNYRALDLEKIIEEGKSSTEIKLKANEFLKSLLVKTFTDESNGKETGILQYGEKVAFNKKYLDTMLMPFKDMDITVYYPRNKYSPIVIQSDNQKAILLPIRLRNDNY